MLKAKNQLNNTNYEYRSRSRPGASGLHLCFFADDVVLLAPPSKDFHLTLGWFTVVLLHSWDENWHLQIQGWKRVSFLLQVRGEHPQVEEFKHLGIIFRSEDDRRIGAAATVIRLLYWSVVIKKEVSRKAMFSIL